MLIAIMQNTFEEVKEEKKQSAMSEKINILNDFRLILEKMDLKMNFQYVFIVKPRTHTEEDDSIGGKMDHLTEIFDKTTCKII